VRYTTVLLQVLVLTVAVPLFSTRLQAQSEDPPRNLVGVELLGRGGIYSFNYERLLTNRMGAGGGISVLSLSSGGIFSPSQTTTTIIMPAYLSWTPVGSTHSPYLSAGLTWSPSKTRELLLGNTRYGSLVFSTITAGYQYRSEKGIVIRPTVSRIVIDGDDLFWPGITLGYAF
jgi:hypothetical protein